MRLSIIIPVYNAAAYLERAITSAIRAGSQVQGHWELLLVDNNSTDGSPAILQAYHARYPDRIRTLTASKQGAPSARNVALALARGEWIQFLDADDYLNPGKIAAQLALTTTTTDWVIGAYRNQYPDGSTSDSIPLPDPWQGLVQDLRIGHTNSNLYRRSALTRAGNWNEATPAYDDPNLYFRLLRTEASYLIDPVVRSTYYHHAGPRVTSGDPIPQVAQALQLLAEVNAHLSRAAPEYWQTHASLFVGALLRKIRILATHDLAAATRAYTRYFGPGAIYADVGRPHQLLPSYTRLYPTLGFRNLERGRLLLARYLPSALKQKLKA
ncbi:Undecaprenyl-phosphate 4-deoxy-4-formamido-L-arabinose transferase [Neolewinella maritima]|uniref:Undecaprenyl-phosphate 4-deoxy-4-formamido-L-arabinose transferase n=1 Tax=Neolewinella maritima TaxID=1383882 RepID=A0ABM9AYH3_9BACT|nr:glycosyltransferase family 2 protein [Neolewinella maritima]CAH0999261.1 Undecaprenyl-phosphate 4-deoxy-4-formamido-L-arabinose transferase [Neolewinella maritima]